MESSTNKKINDINIKSITIKKGQNNSNNNPQFEEKNKTSENGNSERKKAENEENKNIVLYESRNKSSKWNWFKTFLCCIETE